MGRKRLLLVVLLFIILGFIPPKGSASHWGAPHFVTSSLYELVFPRYVVVSGADRHDGMDPGTLNVPYGRVLLERLADEGSGLGDVSLDEGTQPAIGDALPGEWDWHDEELALQGELSLDSAYGTAFALKRDGVVGEGSAGINRDFRFDFIQRILLKGYMSERLYLEFDYDSERGKDPLSEEKNIYSMSYLGRQDEFLKELTLGNKELAITDSRYFPIDEGNQDSFGLRLKGGRGNFFVEGLLRYSVAFQGRKEFSGTKTKVTMEALDTDYVRRRFFFLPDTDIDENSLLVYRTTTDLVSVVVDGKNFKLLSRGSDYDFDNTRGEVFLREELDTGEEIVVYYEKGGAPVGDASLGRNAIIDPAGSRADFDTGTYPMYFGTGGSTTYLYLSKSDLDSYWELDNGYYLEEFEGGVLSEVKVDLLFTDNKGENNNYDDLLDQYVIDTDRGVIFFRFEDGVGFYPRPFPGSEPYPTENPFAADNPIYGGVGEPDPEDSVNTLEVTYSYTSDTFFLDFNVIPGSVSVTVNGALLDPSLYFVEYDLGFITFDEGVITPSSNVVVNYSYTTFGTGDQSLLGAVGVGLDTGTFTIYNLTAYTTDIPGQEAPDVGSEPGNALVNSTELSWKLGAVEDTDPGTYAEIDSGFAFSYANRNVYGTAVVADMETGDYFADVSNGQDDWVIATQSSLLTQPPVSLSLDTRGDVLFKDYFTKSLFGGDDLLPVSSSIPPDRVFDYADKAGPYNSGDEPGNNDERSLVIDYAFTASSTNPYATVVTYLNGEDYTRYERFNLLLRSEDVAGDRVRVYVELLQEYDEDLNDNGHLDGEGSINDSGYSTTPEEGNPTVIGSDREGRSNGRLDSEDLDHDNLLDTGPEKGVVIAGESNDYVVQLELGDSGWQLVSVDILGLIESDPTVFQYANFLRITVVPETSPLPQDATGKILVNRFWFSGSQIVNNDKDYLNVSEVSTQDDPEVAADAFSKTFPDLYEKLHGSESYRSRNDLEEKVLKVEFSTATQVLPQGSSATLSRKFASPQNLTGYGELFLYLFLPDTETLPADLSFTISLLSSENENLSVDLPSSLIVSGWNELRVGLDPPYEAYANGSAAGNMTKTGSLNVLKRVSEVRFGFTADAGDISGDTFTVWLDEWHVSDSQGYWDKACYAEGKLGYRGDVISVGSFPLLGDPLMSVGYERREGYFYGESDDQSDAWYARVESTLFHCLRTGYSLRREEVEPKREAEDLPFDLTTGLSSRYQSHEIVFDTGEESIPVLEHTFDQNVTTTRDVELNDVDYSHKSERVVDESLSFSEFERFPFGLSQSYSFTKSWEFTDRSVVEPEVSQDVTEEEDALYGQVHALDLSFDWRSNSIHTSFSRDEEYTGTSVPFTGDYWRSYSHKLSTLFGTPDSALSDSDRSSKTDTWDFGVVVPVKRSAGFTFLYDTTFTEQNFQKVNTVRDADFSHSINLSVPFFFLGEPRILVTPSLERGFDGEYDEARNTLTEENIIFDSFRYLFAPPLFYVSPFGGLGRRKDYETVNLFKASEEVEGSSTNTLTNTYRTDVSLGYDRWFIPRSVGVYFDGLTTRTGDTYGQTRGWGFDVSNRIPLAAARPSTQRDVTLTFSYQNERDFAQKVLQNTYELDTQLVSLKTQNSGVKVEHDISYSTSTQRLNDPALLLFPGDPSGEIPVAERADSDTLTNSLSFQYLWEVLLRGRALFGIVKTNPEYEGHVRNVETLTVENEYTFTERDKVPAFSNIPIRVTLEHTSDYEMSETILFGFYFLSVIGVEEKVFPESTTGNSIPSMGLEFGVNMKVIF